MNVYATPGPGAGDIVIIGAAILIAAVWVVCKLRGRAYGQRRDHAN